MYTNKDIADFIKDNIEYNPSYIKVMFYNPIYFYADNHFYYDTDDLFEYIRRERFIRSMYIIALEAFI